MTAELPIIQDGISLLAGRGFLRRFFCRPEISFHLLGCLVIETLANQYFVAADFDQYDSLFRQPGMTSAQRAPGIRRRRVLRNFAICSQTLALLIAFGQRFRVPRPDLPGLCRPRQGETYRTPMGADLSPLGFPAK